MTLLRRTARAIALAATSLGLAATMLTTTAQATPVAAEHHGVSTAGKYEKWVKTFARDQRLRRGCHYYFFSYRVTIPKEGRDDWAVEFFIKKPNGKSLAAPVAISYADKLKGRIRYRVCRPPAYPGRYTFKPKVSWTDDAGTLHEGYARPTHFRFLDVPRPPS